MPLTRRHWMGTAAAGLLAAPVAGAWPSERVRIAAVGLRGRGKQLLGFFADRPDVEVATVCDVDTRLFGAAVKDVEQRSGRTPTTARDFRTVLDDPTIDAVVCATPDHWHALQTVWACQAGKDVYVEKPTAHNPFESRQMVAAARKYDRVVQVGAQNRSAAYVREAVDHIASGQLGEVHYARVLNSKIRTPVPARADVQPPAGVDYGLWLGPAPLRPFNENRFHYAWHWFWDYSGGDIINDGIHQIDIARWLLGVDLPTAVSSAGGKLAVDDAQETPDTHTAAWEFPGLTVSFEQTLWTPYMRKTPFALRGTDNLPSWPFSGTRVEVYGSRELMYMGRHGAGWQAFDSAGRPLTPHPGRPADHDHVGNFLDCIRDRRQPNADIEKLHKSTLWCHYANAAFRTGRRLRIDSATEGFVDGGAADALLTRTFREPYAMPATV